MNNKGKASALLIAILAVCVFMFGTFFLVVAFPNMAETILKIWLGVMLIAFVLVSIATTVLRSRKRKEFMKLLEETKRLNSKR